MIVTRRQPVIVGAAACLTDGPPDEVVFAAARGALDDAGLARRDVDLSVVASIDLYDGVSMSNSATTPAAGGWMTNEYRLQADSGVALVSAAAAIRAEQADVALVVGLHCPQTRDREEFDDRVSALSFEPLFERPVGMTATAALGLHAAREIDAGATTIRQLAEIAAKERSRGGDAVTADDVLAAPAAATPLTTMMLAAPASGAVAIVLAAPARAHSCRRVRATITGHGIAGGGTLSTAQWLHAPESASRAAAQAAFARAEIRGAEADVVEFTAASPALVTPLHDALGINGLDDARVGPSGGARCAYPGAANGALRTLEALEWLEHNAEPGARAVVHSADNLSGPIAATATVHVLERL